MSGSLKLVMILFAMLASAPFLAADSPSIQNANNSVGATSINGANPTSNNDPKPRLQHIAIPADQITSSLPRDEKYLPIDRKKWAEIEATFAKENSNAKENRSLHAAEHALEEIEWRAELKGTVLVGELTCLSRHGPNAPRIATLEPWAFSGKDGFWQDKREPLVWGIDAKGKTRVSVTEEGPFVIPVRISCTERDGDLHLNAAFPGALSRKLVIRLPSRYKMSLDDGVLVNQRQANSQTNEWTWQLTGSNALAMHLSVRPDTLTSSDTLIVAPRSVYTAGSRGMKLEWEVQLDSLPSSVERLPIEADAELNFLSIASGEEALVYEEAPRSDTAKNKQPEATATSKYFINFPAQFLKQQRTLKITATAQLVTEKLWRLPQITIPGALVTGQNITLVTLTPYALEQLDLENCQQTHYEKLAAPASGEVTEIQMTGKNPAISTVFRWRTPKGRWQSGTTLMTAGDKIIGKWMADVHLDQGQLNQLDIEVDKGWDVDEIVCETDAVKGTFTKSQTQQSSTTNTFHFLRPLTAGETVRFAITAHPAQSGNDVTLRANEIELATVKHLRREQSFVKLALESEWQSTLIGNPSPILLNETHSKAIHEKPTALFAFPSYTHVPKLFLLPEGRTTWQFHASPFKEAFRTELVSALHVTDSRAKDLYEVRLKSGETKMNHVAVWFNEIRPEETVWELTQPRQLSVRARRLKSSEQTELGFAESGEAWELNWAEPLDGEIVLIGERTFDPKNEISPVMVTLEPRFEQRGILKFSAAIQKFPRVVIAEKNPLPQLPFQEKGQQGLLGSWEYLGKNRNSILQNEVPTLVLNSDAPNARSKELIIWDSRLDSVCVPKSPTQNILTARIENPGLTNWKIELPRDATLRNVRINGATANWHRTSAERHEYSIEILPTARFIVAQLVWSNETDQGHWSLSSKAEWPTCREKFLSREWYVWSPQDYQPMWKQNFEQIVPPAVQTYWERLLGPVIPSSHGNDKSPWWIFSSRNEADYNRISSAANDRLKSNSEVFFAILQNQLDAASSRANTTPPTADINDLPNSDTLELDEVQQPPDSASNATWSTMIDTAWQRSFRQNAAGLENLWIDGAALSDLGIQPALAPNSILTTNTTSRLLVPLDVFAADAETTSTGNPRRDALSTNAHRQKSVAVSKNLVLLALPDGWLLTTRHGLSLWPEPRPLPNCDRMYYCSLTQTEMDSLAYNSSSLLGGHLSSLLQWRDSANKSATAWVEGLMQSHDQIPTSWLPRQVRQEYLDAGPVHLVHGPSLSAWRIGVFVITLGLSTFWIVWRAPFKILLYGFVALIAVAIPWGLSPLGNGVVWGMIVGQILRWLNCWPWRGWRTSDVIAKKSSVRDQSTSQSTINLLTGNIAPIAILIVILLAQNLFAQNGFSKGETAKPNVDRNLSDQKSEKLWTIYVPVDEKTLPTGDYVYVPAQLWDEIQSRTDRESDLQKKQQETADQKWFLTTANYTSEITHSETNTSATSAAWRLEMQLHTLEKNMWVSLPFNEQEIVLIPSEFKLDDHEANWRWGEQRKSIELLVKKAGSHKLNLQFQPQPRESRTEIDLDFKIPFASHNEFTIRAHGDLQLSPLMTGEWSWDAEQQILKGTTGPIAQVLLDYQLKDSKTTATTKIELEMMQWLKLRAANATLEMRISRVLNGQLKKLELEVDPRLKLIPSLPNPNNPMSVRQNGGLVQIEFQRPQSERTAIDLSFLVADYELNKPLTVPRIRVKQHELKMSWLFGSVEHGIRVTDQRKPPKGLKEIPPVEVARLWLDETNEPQFAFHIDSPTYEWVFTPRSISPKPISTTSTTRILVAPTETTWNCVTTYGIDRRNSNYWTIRGLVPERVQIDTVQLINNDTPVAVRWAVGEARHLAVFSEVALTGKIELRIVGRFPTVLDTEQRLQHFQLEGTYPSDKILIERDPKTLVQANWEKDWKNVPEKEFIKKEIELNNTYLSTASAPLLQSVMHGKSTDEGFSLKVTSNANDARITLVSTLQKRENGWYVVYDFLGSSKQGQLDQFAFQAPSYLLEPKAAESTTRLIHEEQATAATQKWLVRPAKSWTNQWAERIEFRIPADALKSLQLPRARLLSHRTEREFFVLPDRVQGIELNWLVRGTALAELPTNYQTILSPADAPIGLSVRSPRINVQIQLIEPVKTQSVVHLADYGLNWQKSFEEIGVTSSSASKIEQSSVQNSSRWKVNGVAHFHIDPNGAKSCIVSLPENCSLIDGKTAGTAMAWTKVKETEWEVNFSDTLLPQHISVIFSISLDENIVAESVAFRFPSIKNLPVDQTLVTNWNSNQLQITNPLARINSSVNPLAKTSLSSLTPSTIPNPADPSTPNPSSQPPIAPSTSKPHWHALDLTGSTLQRLDILSRIIEKGFTVSPPNRQNDNFLGWYKESIGRWENWLSILKSNSSIASNNIAAGSLGNEPNQLEREITRLENSQLQLAKNGYAAVLQQSISDAESGTSSSNTLWLTQSTQQGDTQFWSFAGPVDQLSLNVVAAPDTYQQTRWLLVVAGLLSVSIASVIAARLHFNGLEKRHRIAVLLAICAIWWWWFQPREIALFLALIAGLIFWIQRIEKEDPVQES